MLAVLAGAERTDCAPLCAPRPLSPRLFKSVFVVLSVGGVVLLQSFRGARKKPIFLIAHFTAKSNTVKGAKCQGARALCICAEIRARANFNP